MMTIRQTLITAIVLMMAFAVVQADEQAKAAFEQPILISSAGQSADVKLVGMLAKRQKLNITIADMAQPADLDGIKTLVIVPGFSSKGLGAAGVSQKDEEERVNTLVAAAQEKGVPIVMVHIGGNARRGAQSDGFCRTAAEASSHMIVVSQGNEDGFFSTIATENEVPIEVVEKIAKAAKPLGSLFKTE